MESEFTGGKRKKKVLWGKVLDKMKDVNPEITQPKDVLQRKFLNLLASYKRIKKRNNFTARDATTWDFFDDFDNVYGRRHSIQPPEQNLQSSLPSSCHENVNESQSDSDGIDLDTSISSVSRPSKRVKRSTNETLVFFKEEAEREQKRHEEVLKVEKEKLQMEREKIKAMEELRKVLEKRM